MENLKWWKQAVFYQIYPRSFADGNGDGIGDLEGMIGKLDYLHDLGVDALWLSPHYPSPLYDCGYDISDYTSVGPEYGTMDDFRRFLDEAHRRELRVILDLVLNHTSDQHPWFIESRSSRNNPKRDWYIWRDAKNGGPPNNWYSTFGGPAWEYDSLTEQYYYHFFFKQQPDLNWNNPQVRQAMYNVMRFWLDMGVDGFRLDAIGTLFEDQELHDHTSQLNETEFYKIGRKAQTPEELKLYTAHFMDLFGLQHDQPEIHEVMCELRAVCDEYPDRMLVGETEDLSYYGETGEDELHIIFNFPLMKTDRMTPKFIRDNQRERLAGIPPNGWPCNTLGNHDSPRMKSRYGDGLHDDAIARLLLALILTLRGTPFLYYGEEIGMTDFPLKKIGEFKDLLGLWAYQMEIDVVKASPDAALEFANQLGRDKCRTPMQWDNQANGGFSPPGVQTWLPVNPNFANGVNVQDQDLERSSLLNFYRSMLAMRKKNPALVQGDYQLAPVPHSRSSDYLAFYRRFYQQNCLVVLNWSTNQHQLDFGPQARSARLVFSSHKPEGQTMNMRHVELAPFEILIIEVA